MESEQEKANPPTARETFAVSPARLAWRSVGRETREGDIHASYSADVIASAGRVRKPFKWNGALCICTSISGAGLTATGFQEHEAYRIVPITLFKGGATTYHERNANAEAARHDANGFYHGVTIKHGSDSFVLCGPPVRFTADPSPTRPDIAPGEEPLQISLF